MIETIHHRNWARMPLDYKDPSLVLYLPLWYPYSDMTGAAIRSYDRNRHSCTVEGTTKGREGIILDGLDDYLSITDGSVLDFTTQDFSLEAWIKPATFAAANRVFLKGDPAGSVAGYTAFFDITNIVFDMCDGVDTAETYGAHGKSANTWWHVVFVRSGLTGAIFIDGKAITLTANNAQDMASAAAYPSIFGTDTLALNRFWFDGIIGEIRIYNRALAVAEIQRNYQATKWRY